MEGLERRWPMWSLLVLVALVPTNVAAWPLSAAGVCNAGKCIGVVYEGECRADCPDGLVRDRIYCVTLKPECGDFCIECTSDNTACARCEYSKVHPGLTLAYCCPHAVPFDRAHFQFSHAMIFLQLLDDGVCGDECRAKAKDGTSLYNSTLEGKFCRSVPEASSKNNDDVVAEAPTSIALNPVPMDTRGSGPSFDEPVASTSATAVPQPGMYYDDVTAVSIKDRNQWKQTMRKAAGKSRKLLDIDLIPDATIEHIIDAVPVATLDDEQATHIFRQLDTLRPDRGTFAVILKEMQYKREQTPSAGRAKYETIVADLTRFLRLFRMRTDAREFPADTARLMQWAQVWGGALLLCDHLLSQPECVAGQTILELGAGTGLCTLLAAALGARAAYATDIGERVLANLIRNVTLNEALWDPSKTHVHVRDVNWLCPPRSLTNQAEALHPPAKRVCRPTQFDWTAADTAVLRAHPAVVLAADGTLLPTYMLSSRTNALLECSTVPQSAVAYLDDATYAFADLLASLFEQNLATCCYLAVEKRCVMQLPGRAC
ncbi:uncharacterized protein MONBRDRAFT_7669 [Monosiga brevicollis MX1]|uniref:Uncharacterized protein n=1 Tax=Monosiga brevicollis TaxID=81824 RepID=A9UXY8_MONBE|nr:uncharacterized protein MONBRDRAFT_7669 [Monosiga brevicollis MX1]EDQ89769.1 predicted protein [Monosiga brevicollis MX1]|eukprot:XP_001745191.1 hypothetical protein [Monosiga brevicollis MX1]